MLQQHYPMGSLADKKLIPLPASNIKKPVNQGAVPVDFHGICLPLVNLNSMPGCPAMFNVGMGIIKG
jgi:hypothetical protein